MTIDKNIFRLIYRAFANLFGSLWVNIYPIKRGGGGERMQCTKHGIFNDLESFLYENRAAIVKRIGMKAQSCLIYHKWLYCGNDQDGPKQYMVLIEAKVVGMTHDLKPS